MDNFLGIGFGEIVLIIIMALFFLGPGKIVKFAQALGRLVNNLKKASSDITTQITKEVDEQETSLKHAAGPAQHEAQEQAKSVSQIAGEFIDGLRSEVKEASSMANQFIGETKAQGGAAKQPVSEIKEPGKTVTRATPQVGKKVDITKSIDIAPETGEIGPSAPV